ncbi:MAG: hypothetical protein NWQ13_09715 [Glaciimonas sp.]|nr:hypothetical protein [Glaciimonas sp.]
MSQVSTSDQNSSSTPAPPKNKKGAFGVLLRGILTVLLIILLVLLLAVIGIWVGARSEVGTEKIWKVATSLSQGHLKGKFIGGTLAEGLRLRDVQFQDKTQQYSIDKIDAAWKLNFSPLKLIVNHLHVGTVDARLQPTPPTPTVFPKSLTIPLALELNNIRLDKLSLHEGVSTTELSNLALHGDSDGKQHNLTLDNLVTPFGSADAVVHLNGVAPFVISGNVALSGAYEQEKYQLNAALSGNLSTLQIALKGQGDKLSATANIAATPFAAIPFERIQLSADHINPKLFSAGAPLADLSLRADLVPVTPPASKVSKENKDNKPKADAVITPEEMPNLATLAVSGPIRITNAAPGALDKDKLPIISVDADVRLDAHTQTLSKFQIKLQKDATINGTGQYHADGKEKNTGAFNFDVAALDLQSIHGKLQPSQLRGPVSIKLTPTTQAITLNLADKNLAAKADVLIDAKQITINVAQLGAGSAALDVKGSFSRDPQMAYVAKGKLRNFDPAVWMKTYAKGSKPITARINLDFDAAGKVSPELQLKLKFGILESEYANLPMSGNGTINLIGKRLLPSDAKLSVAGNDAQLNGSFGNAGDKLNVKIDAPQLQRLGFGISGAVHVDGQVSGSMQRPAVKATYRADKLIFGAHHVDSLSGDADIQADLNANVSAASNRLQLNIAANGYRSTDNATIALNKLNAHLAGTFGNHTLTLDSSGTLHDKPLALTLAAQGKLSESAAGYGWQGTVSELKNQGTPRFALETPLAITAAAGKVSLGATRLSIANAAIDLKNFSFDNGRIRSAGDINALNINTVLEMFLFFTCMSV